MLRLAALGVFVPEDAVRLAARLRLSNAERAVLELGSAKRDELPGEDAAKHALYHLGESNFARNVLLAWADSGAGHGDKAWRAALALPDRWQAPAFPLRGSDVMALDFKGPEIGETLRRLEAEWIEGGFAASRDELLARASAISRRSSRPDR
jgi:poly(A) polymerase